jgi:hypothetical protein
MIPSLLLDYIKQIDKERDEIAPTFKHQTSIAPPFLHRVVRCGSRNRRKKVSPSKGPWLFRTRLKKIVNQVSLHNPMIATGMNLGN